MKDTISTLTATLNITLYVDPCKYAVITAAIANMQLFIDERTLMTSILTMTYDFSNWYTCTLVASLTPAAAYIQLSQDFKTISLDPSLVALPAELGTHAFTLTIAT